MSAAQATVSSLLGLGQANRNPIIPSTVLNVQNTRLLDPSELAKPPDDLLDPGTKKRARRKKVTPTRDSLITAAPPNATVSPSIAQQPAAAIASAVSKSPLTSILSERLQSGNNPGMANDLRNLPTYNQLIALTVVSHHLAEKQTGLSIATPPQLYSPSGSSRSQASVITRLSRPPAQRQPFPTGKFKLSFAAQNYFN